jgi:hypothetical protein
MAVNEAVGALKTAFSNEQVVLHETDAYTTLNASYLSKTQAELQPRAVFLPKNRDDVVQFVRVIKPYALDGSVKFAVRGAGQQPALGCNNVHNGITVDLRSLNAFSSKMIMQLSQLGQVSAGPRSTLNCRSRDLLSLAAEQVQVALAGCLFRVRIHGTSSVFFIYFSPIRWSLLLLNSRRLHLG